MDFPDGFDHKAHMEGPDHSLVYFRPQQGDPTWWEKRHARDHLVHPDLRHGHPGPVPPEPAPSAKRLIEQVKKSYHVAHAHSFDACPFLLCQAASALEGHMKRSNG